MKKLIVIAALGIVFAGCKKADVTVNPNVQSQLTLNNKAAIVGTWHISSSIINTYTNGSLSKAGSNTANGTEIVVFNSDGTGTDDSSNNGGFFTKITYTITDNNILIKYLSASGAPTYTGVIKTLTANRLEIYDDYITASGTTIDDIYTR